MTPGRVALPMLEDEPPVTRPKTRGECAEVERPCPWASCRYNLAIDVDARGIVREVALPKHTTSCALDYADAGQTSSDVLAIELGGLRREVVRDIEARAMAVFTRRALTAGIVDRAPTLDEERRRRAPHPERALATSADRDAEEGGPPGREFASFFENAPDEAVTSSIWTMLSKRSSPPDRRPPDLDTNHTDQGSDE